MHTRSFGLFLHIMMIFVFCFRILLSFFAYSLITRNHINTFKIIVTNYFFVRYVLQCTFRFLIAALYSRQFISLTSFRVPFSFFFWYFRRSFSFNCSLFSGSFFKLLYRILSAIRFCSFLSSFVLLFFLGSDLIFSMKKM